MLTKHLCERGEHNPASTRRLPNVVIMLGRRRRRRSNIITALGQRLVLAGNAVILVICR